MPQFIDFLERKWILNVNYETVKRVRDELQINLLEVVDKIDPKDKTSETLLQRLASDEVLLVDVVSVILTPQINERGLTASQFAEGMMGQGLENATDALIEGIANFSRPQKGRMIRETWSKSKFYESSMTERGIQLLNSPRLSEAVNDQFDRQVDERLNPSRPND